MKYEILDKIQSPADIKELSVIELERLCAEIRDYMIECCSVNPGHLGSSLGAVELIVGLHYIYNTPKDKLVFDVSHQAYAHKIITGRKEAFRNNRKKDGISGFTKISESEYDAFGAGHSSTSISAALGFAEAAKIKGTDEKAVALIGDGALSGGLAFEALNNASESDILVVLNDNNISIDKNIGALHKYLLRVTTSRKYNNLKKQVWEGLGEGPVRDFMQKMTISTKSAMVKRSGGDLFEAMGYRYFGPIDGNNIAQVTHTLKKLHAIKGPRVLHVITTKGKGYAPAEENQTIWHAPGKFDPETGERITMEAGISRYQDVFGEVLVELAKENKKIVGVTPAMASGCGMNLLANEIPERFFDVGIAEGHAVTFSAGLAASGLKPFCNIYSSFSQRAYDMIIHDVALQNLPVVLCFDRAGLVGEDGPTHHGCYDIAAYRSIPGVTIAAPRNEIELKDMMYSASLAENGPYIIRYPRAHGEGVDWKNHKAEILTPGVAEEMISGKNIAIFAAGPVANRAYEAALELKNEEKGHPSVYNVRFIKPLDEKMLKKAAAEHKTIVTIEDGAINGGLYGAVTEYLAKENIKVDVVGVGIPDSYITQGKLPELHSICGFDKDSIKTLIEEIAKKC